MRGATNGYDAINISGSLFAGGALDVVSIDGYTPSGPATFDLFDFASFGGSFAQINLPVVAGHTWNTAQLSFDGTISLVASATPKPAAATRRRRRRVSGLPKA